VTIEHQPDLRRATEADVDAVHRIQVDAIRLGTGGAYSPEAMEAWAGAFNRDGFVGKLDRCEVWIAADVDGALGYVSLDPASREIDSVYVAPTAAGKGVGSVLMRHILDIARVRGLESVWLDASKNAIPFYRRLGFSISEEVVRKPCGVSVRCTRMGRSLD